MRGRETENGDERNREGRARNKEGRGRETDEGEAEEKIREGVEQRGEGEKIAGEERGVEERQGIGKVEMRNNDECLYLGLSIPCKFSGIIG